MSPQIQIATTPEEIERLYDFIRQFPFDYLSYLQWLEKCKRELELHYEHQNLGSLLVSLAELYAKENDYKRIQGDAHQENPVVSFMQKREYRIEAQESLYTAKKEN